MSFSEVLVCYITQFGCTAKDICEKSGISAAALSRYRSGERIPDVTSEMFAKLCMALVEIANENGITEITESSIRESFLSATEINSVSEKHLMQNFEKLISVLNLNINRLCRHINYDVSTVFRFRNGTRKLADPEKFASAVAGYITREFDDAQTKSILAALLVCDENSLSDSSVRFERLTEWLLSGKPEKDNTISDFLNKLDNFDLNEYIKVIHFDEMKVPTVPFQRSTSKTYFGLDEMMESELDFLKATVLSKSMDPVILYSDMPMGKMSKDPEFPKKWMFGMAMMLKKGLHLNMIHNMDRSFEEMMLGLESYIPMYMTGQISPFYLKNTQNNVFLHFLKVSGSAALSGEAITGHHSNGKYYLTKSKKELEYYSKRAHDLLSCASPLMDIYGSDNANGLNAFLVADAKKDGKRRSILSTLPLYTMDQSLLESMLTRYNLNAEEKQKILDYAFEKRNRVKRILETNCIEDEISNVTESDFINRPLTLDLSGAFFDKDISYTYDEYLAHLKSTEQFVEMHPHYILKKTTSQAFSNLQITIHEGKWAMVSKAKAPTIHFVIHHPKLENAIENFIPPLVEKIK